MDNLPNDLLHKIFGELNINDLISVCFLCNKFNNSIDELFIEQWINNNGSQEILTEYKIIETLKYLSQNQRWSKIPLSLSIDNSHIVYDYAINNNIKNIKNLGNIQEMTLRIKNIDENQFLNNILIKVTK
jgi:hypothetical protein